MKSMVFLMILIILAVAGVILYGGGGSGKTFFGMETAYCKEVAAKKAAASGDDYAGEYKGRFADFLHGCW